MHHKSNENVVSRRNFLAAAGAFGAGVGAGGLLSACTRKSGGADEVVLYSSVDEPLLRPIANEFEKRSGVRVRVVADTEATKSTGLIERLLAERNSPRADVWWSSEQLGVLELARAGALSPMAPRCVAEFPGGWPANLRDPGGLWHGFALRARVIVHSTKRVEAKDVPHSLGDLLQDRFRGRVGMANPAFGTTRGHLAALVAERGEDATRAWLAALKERGLKVFGANSAVVRAVSQGEIDVGLTDTDDVHAGQANGWAVAMAFEGGAAGDAGIEQADPQMFSGGGALVIPNTVAMVKGGPNPSNAATLIEYLLSADVEGVMADSESKNTPIRADLLSHHPDLRIDNAWNADPKKLLEALPKASTIAREVLGPG